MQNIRIEKPCTENWNQMTPTEKGAFCQKCAMEVYDFTNQSSEEIKHVLRSQLGQRVCGRFKVKQQDALNEEFEAWKFNNKRSMQRAMVFSLIVVFGLTLFSCTNKNDERNLVKLQQSVTSALVQGTNTIAQQGGNYKEELKMGIVPFDENMLIEDVPEIEPEIEIIEEEILDFSEVEVTSSYKDLPNEEYVLGGAMMTTHLYREYLLEPVPVDDPLRQIELDENGLEIPKEFGAKAYPNPASTETTFEFKLPEDEKQVSIFMFDMNGSLVRTIYSGELKRGTRTFTIDVMDLTPGIYLINLVSPDFKKTVRVSKT